MKTTVKTCAQWTAFIALCLIGCLAFMLVAGDEDPTNPIPFSQFLLLKAAGGVGLYLCYRVGRWLHRHGYLPEYLDRMTEEEV